MALYIRYNNEGILIRGVLAGLLDILNHLEYNQVWGNSSEETEIISVPWWYNFSGDERFMQDFFTFYGSCLPPRPIDGNFSQIPLGIITYAGSSIDAQRITSRYVQGRYVKEVDGKLESYVSFLYSLPLKVRIECEMQIDRQITALKIEQEIRETFYKTLTYYTYYKGMRVGCTVGFPEDIAIEKNIQYSFESNNPIKLTFQLEIETYQPVFDKTTEMKATTKIKGFNYDIQRGGQPKVPGNIEIITPVEGAVIPKGIPLWVEWSFTRETYVIPKVDIYWLYTNTNERFVIDRLQPNHEYYIWNIPTDFTTYVEPTIIWENRSIDNTYLEAVSVSRTPLIKIIPDLSTNIISSSSFRVLDPGYFFSPPNSSINLQLEMKDPITGAISYTGDGSIWGTITNNYLDSSIYTTPGIVFPGEIGSIESKIIDLHVANSNFPENNFGIVNRITIV